MDAADRLRATELVKSLEFRVLAYGRHDYACLAVELVKWKRAFEKELSKHGYPLYCESIGFDWAWYYHLRRLRELSRSEWNIIGAIGGEVARKLDVPVYWGALDAPWLWLLVQPTRAG